VSFDKVRVLSDVATPRTERRLCDQAKECTVRQLADIARSAEELARASSPAQGRSEHDRRFVRFNDEHRTMSAQLPSESYAEIRARVEAVAKEIPSEGDTPWDHRRADALTELVHLAGSGTGSGVTASPYVVVVHAPLEALVDESGEESELAGDLERHGLIDTETVKRIACDATIVIAADDHLGHTMYEGRARRFPTQAQRREVRRRDRCCRFPGCSNNTFTAVHHIEEWKPSGRTDLPNLVLLCKHHHGLVHRKVWTMTGNANEELTFIGPGGRVMTSRPSSKWTRVRPGR
jgi:predicted restriction endonuclease